MQLTTKTTAVLWGAGGVAWVANGAVGLDAVAGTGGFYVAEAVWIGVYALVLGDSWATTGSASAEARGGGRGD